MTEEQTRAISRLSELFDEAPHVVGLERKSDLEGRLTSSDESVWQDAVDEVHEIWIEVLYKISQELEDNRLSAIGKRLLVALKTLISDYPALGLEIPSFSIQLYSGNPKLARMAISQMREILEHITGEIRKIRSKRKDSSPSPTD